MIKIAVCDDERFYRLRIKKLITKYLARKIFFVKLILTVLAQI